MWESGGLVIKTIENDGVYIPFAFDVKNADIDHPVINKNILHYFSDDNHDDKFNVIKKFLFSIHSGMTQKNLYNNYDIESRLKELWTSGYSEKLDTLEKEMRDLTSSGYGIKRSSAASNECYSLATFDQIDFSLINNFQPTKVSELEVMFENFLYTQVSNNYTIPDKFENGETAHRVIIGSTRFSNFAVFTDGERIVIFDRQKDKPNTNVTNDRYDVFGSVQFENRSIKTKIKSKKFLEAPIIKIQEICGIAIEYNHNKRDHEVKETVVMLGICIHMSSADINLAAQNTNNGEIVICDIRALLNFNQDKLTSKARLALRHLSSKPSSAK